MGLLSFYSTLSSTASNRDYLGIFGTVDSTDTNLMAISALGLLIVKWVRYRLGEPIMTVLLTNNQIFACFLLANILYSRLVNTHQVQMWFLNLLGLSAAGNFTGQTPNPNLNFVKKASRYYSQLGKPIVGGGRSRRKAYIDTTSNTVNNSSVFNLIQDTVDIASGSSLSAYLTTLIGSSITRNLLRHVKITLIYYYPSSTVNKFWDVYSISNNFFPSHRLMLNWRYRLRPVFLTVLNAQMLQLHQFVRQANYNFNIVGDNITVSPSPQGVARIYFDYMIYDKPVLSTDEDLTDVGTDHDITSIWDAPYKNIPYNALNSIAKRWIRQFALALRKLTLGLVRRKFSTINIPNDSVTLDGGSLVSLGITKQQGLRDLLRIHLDKLSLLSASLRDARLSENINRQLRQVPMGIFIG